MRATERVGGMRLGGLATEGRTDGTDRTDRRVRRYGGYGAM